ncbi:hypothetical protein [Geodermatophilus maliterrae]|uniref:DUF5642 domain-containing protein n=1 Tax=Geodermatophilus maliterrae TaxID=3162531 RepID=A0ABV3XJQ6_9ACTN
MTCRRRPVLAAAAGLLAAPLLAACGGDDVGGTASPASTSSAAASSAAAESSASPAGASASGGTDLAPGLLPAEAFGAGAQVTPLTEQQLAQGAALAGGSVEGLEVSPPECADVVQGTQPSFDEYEDVAAQVAVLGTTTTVQALVGGGPAADALSTFEPPRDGCTSVQVTSPEIGTAIVDYAELDVPDLGDGSAGASVTTTVTGPDGQPLSVPALVGVVQDGERALVLLSTDTQGGTPDPAAFADLLQQAFDAQAAALD